MTILSDIQNGTNLQHYNNIKSKHLLLQKSEANKKKKKGRNTNFWVVKVRVIYRASVHITCIYDYSTESNENRCTNITNTYIYHSILSHI